MFKDVGDYLSFKQRKETDKAVAAEWAQLEELYNKKWVQGYKLIIPDYGFWCDILLLVDGSANFKTPNSIYI